MLNGGNTPRDDMSAVTLLFIFAIVLVLVTPLVFMAVGMTAGWSFAEAISALGTQVEPYDPNIFLVSLIGLLPLILLALVIWISFLISKRTMRTAAYVLGGAIPIVAVMLFVNLEYWPAYLPDRTFLGFPHGLEFVIGPLVFAPIAALVGLIFTRLVLASRS